MEFFRVVGTKIANDRINFAANCRTNYVGIMLQAILKHCQINYLLRRNWETINHAELVVQIFGKVATRYDESVVETYVMLGHAAKAQTKVHIRSICITHEHFITRAQLQTFTKKPALNTQT